MGAVRLRRATGTALGVGAVALLLAIGPLAVSGAGAASSGQPAFTTSQAPGGAATAGQRVIALTFDDGPGPFTPQVLSVLERDQVPATFFEIGDEVASYPQYSKMVAAAGFPVEDHTWSHPDLTTLPASGVAAQIDMTQAEIQAVTGTTPRCVRPPYDAWNAGVLSQIAARGLTTMSYSVDPKDWTLPGVQAIADRVVGAAFPGAVVDMHDAGGDRSQTVAALPQIISRLRAMGYAFVSICGSGPTSRPQVSATYAFGNAPAPGPPVTSNLPFVGAAAADAGGYWEVAADGGLFSFGDAVFHGSMGGTRLNAPIVGMAATADGGGYWEVAADGGIFSFGDAVFHGSMGGTRLNAPIVGMAATADRGGYWEVAADGGIFSFGDAVFHGSMGGMALDAPVVGMAAAADGAGYWEVAGDGGIFSFGDAVFHGSMGGTALNAPVVGMAAAADGGGYWQVAADGGVFGFDAPFYGSGTGAPAEDRFFAMVSANGGAGYLLTAQHPAG
jgi:peptidoglycan/xylan/chitin deacetylase (PgdA/CDA1 family)